MERITAARFVSKTNKGAIVAFESTMRIKDGERASLYADGKLISKALVAPTERAGGIASFAMSFDFEKSYTLKVGGAAGFPVSKSLLADDPDFIRTFERDASEYTDYGVSADEGGAKFVVWAPFATRARLRLYDAGAGGECAFECDMRKRIEGGRAWGGVWECKLDGNRLGKYYTYVFENGAAVTETIDPYAKACGVNGTRGMIIDLSETDPDGWAKDGFLYRKNPAAADCPIVWELHVQDFSSSPDSGMKFKGKYLAFTERGTTVPGTSIKTGVDYLKELGITYVQLNPVYDFATVDEGNMTAADNSRDMFNWGYDPLNFNIPEGSYSTDPSDGRVRIREFKQMVMALHNAGIGVVMDVVYNHTYSITGQALHDTVPGYYHRTSGGEFTDGSGCGNETASERGMMRKYIIDSVVYWAKEYHIDGFRFDLMGLHDLFTVRSIREALDALDGGDGKKLLMYGEPWSADGAFVPESFSARIAAAGETDNALIKNCSPAELPERVAIFNDEVRDGVRGDNNLHSRGWMSGNASRSGAVAAGLNGTAKGVTASRNIAYVSAHDNYTLWDQAVGKEGGTETPLYYEQPTDYCLKQCFLASAAYLMCPGIAFMLAGEEMGRTKYGNHNSYNSPLKLNRIRWSRQAEFGALVSHYKKLIAARKAHREDLFSYEKSTDPEFTAGTFTADGATVSGTRGDLELYLDAGDGQKGRVTIDGKTIVEF